MDNSSAITSWNQPESCYLGMVKKEQLQILPKSLQRNNSKSRMCSLAGLNRSITYVIVQMS